MKPNSDTPFFDSVISLLESARREIAGHINTTMVLTYFEIGRKIVEEEQAGKERAQYGKQLLKELSKRLNEKFGRGFSVDNLQNMRVFYLTYSKYETVSRKLNLSWSHYLFLMKISNTEERTFYEIEASENRWSLRECKRQYDSGLYERLRLSLNHNTVRKLSTHGHIIEQPEDTIKDPYILEFIGLPILQHYSESELEKRLIEKLEHFLLELGKGFTFVTRQKRITLEEKQFYVDLVFYNRILKCFVVIDLKIGELKHQDIGQMMMYVNYFDRYEKSEDENKTIGIILCKQKSQTLVELTLPEDNQQIFASRYLTVLPSKEELQKLIEEKEDYFG